MAFNTRHPVGSTDPRDLYDNATNFDKLINGDDPFYSDRLGKLRQSYSGMEYEFNTAQDGRAAQFDEFLRNSGFVIVGDYGPNITLTARNQLVVRDGYLYRLAYSTTIPYTTTGNWELEGGNFVLQSEQDALRQDLGNSSDLSKGISLIFGASRVVPAIADLRKLPSSGSKYAFATGYSARGDGGGGHYYLDTSDTTTADNAATVIVNADGGRWKLAKQNFLSIKQCGGKVDGTTDDTAAFQRMVDQCETLGLRPEMGKGKILIKSTINIPADRFSLIGAGFDTQIYHGFDGPLFKTKATSTVATYQTFENFNIVSTSTKGSTGYCFDYTPGLVRSVFKNIEVSRGAAGSEPYGFITSAIANTFDTISFINISLNQIVGVGYNLPKGSSIWFHGGRVIGLDALTSTATGLLLNGGMGGVWVWGTDFIQLDTGVWTTANNGTSNRELFLAQGCCDSCARFGYRFSDTAYISAVGIWAASCEVANVQLDTSFAGRLNVAGGTITNAGAYNGTKAKDGLVINGGTRVQLDAVIFADNKGYGIRCPQAAQPVNLLITDCLFAGNGNNSIGGQSVRMSGCDFQTNTAGPDILVNAPGSVKISNTTGINDKVVLVAPAVPASGGTVTYNGYVPAIVYLNGGTVTQVRVNNAQIFSASNVSFLVSPGDTISLTYSAAPTWGFFRVDA